MPLRFEKVHPYLWISLIGLLVWGWTISFGFVWDDFPMIVTNPSLNSWRTLITGWTHDFWMLHDSPQWSGYWRPVATFLHTIIAHMFGKSAWAFHLLNVILHIATACLFYSFLKNINVVRWVWIPTLFFLLHPIQAEAVSFSSAIPDLLCAFFGWLALASWTQPNSQQNRKMFKVFGCLSLSLLSKESGIFFVLFLIFVDMVIRKSVRPKKNWICLLGLCVAYIYLHVRITGNLGVRTLWGGNWIDHFATVCKLFGYQLLLLVFPLGSSPTRDFNIVITMSDLGFWVGFLLLMSVILSFLYAIRKRDIRWQLILGGFLIFWFPVSNIIPAESLIADRYLYIMVAMLGMAFGLLFENFDQVPRPACVIFLLFSVLAFSQASAWRNQETLWSHAVKTSPKSSVAWNEWGNVLLGRQKFEEASQAYEKATELRPFYREASLNRALVPYAVKDNKKAKEILLEHLKRFKNDDQAYDLLGTIYEAESKFDDSIDATRSAVHIAPNQWKYRYNLGEVFLRVRDYPNAISELQQADRLAQNRYEILKNLGFAYFQNGQYREARDTFEELIQKFPEKSAAVQIQYEKSKQILQIMGTT